MASLLVDLELGEQAVADLEEGPIDGLGAGVGEGDRAPGPLVVTARRADAVDDLAEDLARVAAEVGGPAYAIDEQTAIAVVDGTVAVVSEGTWKAFP